eukprot:Nitzschia sp. Nitz4//scaffold35_size145790//94357//94985//NITZ4_003038-RA/size145790-augustus-gene-0.121-mRNA-1//1//CDS//3329549148//1457//frame0
MSTASYTPISSELLQAISEILRDKIDPSISAKDLRSELLQDHPNWNIPERRVHKFLKRHLSQASLNGSGNSLSVASEVSTSVRKVFGRVIGSAISSKSSEEILILEEETETAPIVSEREEEKPDPEEPVAIAEEEVVDPAANDDVMERTLEEARSLEQIYSDDRDEEKKDCECTTPCVIM